MLLTEQWKSDTGSKIES